jgi:hypothetical protein
MHQFREHHSEFEGFSDFFARDIHPILAERDVVRKKAVKTGLIGGAVTLLILLSIGGFLLWRFGDSFFGFLVIGMALVSPLAVFAITTQDIRDETKERIVGAIVGYIGWTFKADVPTFDLTPFRDLFLIPKRADRTSYEDSLSGQAHGAAFRSVEAHLEVESRDSKGNRNWKTVFRGQLMTLDFPTTTFGRTIVLRDKGWFNRKKQSDMKRIGLADPVFEKIFEAYGTDQVEGRVILEPAFMQRMVDLEQTISGKNIRFGFDQDRLYIAVETADQYEAGSMFKSLTDPKRTQKILDEVGAIYDIVDLLKAKPRRNRRT